MSGKHSGIKPKDQRSRRQLNPMNSSNEPQPQKTISELFATSKQGLKSRETDDLPGASPSKKLKTNHTIQEPGDTSVMASTMRVEDRYKFSSPQSRRTSEIAPIDLTKSPNASPARNKLSTGRSSNSTPHTGPKMLVVKGLKRVSRPDPEEYYNRVWVQLDAALSTIFLGERLSSSMEELYRGVEILCKQDRASALYKKLCEKCTWNITTRVRETLVHASDTESAVEILEAVVQAWSTWSQQVETVRAIFFYLDRSYLLRSAALPSIQEMATNEYRNYVFSSSQLKGKVLEGACDLVNADRRGDRVAFNERLFRDAIKMFHSLAVYTKWFEPRLMADSEKYFLDWTKQTVATNDLAGYVHMCGKLMYAETHRCDNYCLDQTTKKGLETYLEDILVDQQQARLTDVIDVEDLLAVDDAQPLSKLFSLLQRRRLGEKLRPAFEAFINKKGSEIVFDEEREQEMVMRLLLFKRKLDSIWEHSFEKHEGLGHSLREAFENFINKSKRSNMTWGTDNPKPGEMIAKYVDVVLKGGTKAIRASGFGFSQGSAEKAVEKEEEEGSSEDEDVEIGKQLDQVLDLFRFVHGKAVFEAFYKRDLARRLLLGRSASADSEKSMLTRLKSECGAGFTHNLEQMFKDIEMAREEITSYKSMFEERQTQPAFDLSVNVLSSASWPTYPSVSVNVPESILKATRNFETHYKLKSVFPKGAKEIVVSCFQAVILIAFNNDESRSYGELKAASALDDAELKRTLQSLACARYRVLSKTPKGKDVNSGDTFTVNLNFSHPKYRIKINQIQAKETKQENQQTHERIAADRYFETQAAVVRIMKSRKKITHAELVSEVITATKSRGVLDPADIKKTIERLIDKEYMERDDKGHNVYNYVA